MNLTTGRPVRLMRNAMTWDQQTFTASFRIAGRRCQVLPDGYYRATLPAGCVTDPAGNPLAQDYVFDFHILAGDANGDAIVDVSDLMILAGNWKGSGKTFSQGDFDYSGVVDEADLALLAKNWQKTPDGTIASSAPLPTIAGITSPPPATPARRSVREVFRPVDVVE